MWPWPQRGVAILCVSVGVLATSCTPLTRGGREQQLNEAADSLLPRDSSIVKRESGDCVTLARSPSCVEVSYFSGDVSLPARQRALTASAQKSGWSTLLERHAIGGAEFVFQRGNLRATVVLWADPRYRRCLRTPAADCADLVVVQRR